MDLYLLPLTGDRRPVLYLAAPGQQAYAQLSPIEERSTPPALFGGIPSAGNSTIYSYVTDDDGQRFLVAATRSGVRSPITPTVNWQSALAERPSAGKP